MIRRIIIVGGGLAGIAAAMDVAEAGHQPIVLETRRKLGGRATSFVDPRTGVTLDNCQHVLMGCCSNLIDLYDRLGVLEQVRWHRTLYWANPPHAPDRMRPGLLPAPAHFSGSFLRMRQFTFAEKRAIARAMWQMLRLGPRGRVQWRDRTFREFLDECGQSDSLVRRFWNTIVVSACNLDVDRVAASAALHVFQEGFLAGSWHAAMGLPGTPLVEIYDPAQQAIEKAGGAVHMGVSAKAITWDGSRATGVVTDEGMFEGAAVISAVPFDRLDRLVSDALRAADRRLQHLDRIDVSPILGVHLAFDHPVMDLPHLILPGCATQWLFNKGVDDTADRPLQRIHAVISGADDWMELTEEQIVDRVLEDVWRALPRSKGLRPVDARSVKEKRATFAATPGVHAHRPGAAASTIGLGGGGVQNLFLAGDWCDTGWPATMEGAVRSGYAAAAACVGLRGVRPEVPVGVGARLLGLRG